MTSQLAQAVCVRCHGGFSPVEQMVNSNGEIYHEECFVCAQCFQKFPEGLFYEASASQPRVIVTILRVHHDCDKPFAVTTCCHWRHSLSRRTNYQSCEMLPIENEIHSLLLQSWFDTTRLRSI